MKNLAQIQGVDALLAFSIFILLFSFGTGTLDEIFSGTIKARHLERMKLKATEGADQLILSNGFPGYWPAISGGVDDANTISKLGLALEPRKIAQSYIKGFYDLNYQDLKKYLNVAEHEFFIKVEQDGKIVLRRGVYPPLEIGVEVQRIVLYSGRPALMTYIVHDSFHEQHISVCDDGYRYDVNALITNPAPAYCLASPL